MTANKNAVPLINVDKDKCNNCHACISICPVKACIDGSGNRIDIIHSRCLGCGRCITVCHRGARSVSDDTDVFFDDLKNNVPIVVIVAPSAVTVFDNIYKLNGALKSLGVKAIFDVSFGAELTSKSYLHYLETENPPVIISQPCPAIVSFAEIYHPELLPHLAPVHSPMAHTAIMIREFFPEFKNAKIAAISPCLAKKREFEEIGIINYNVTMIKLKQHLEYNAANLSSFDSVLFDGPQAERASGLSTPGGLKYTILRDAPDAHIRSIEGDMNVYKYLVDIPKMILEKTNPKIVDCLSCVAGCNAGLGTGNFGMPIDMLEAKVEKQCAKNIKHFQDASKNKNNKEQIGSIVNKYWKKHIYNRTYTNKSNLMDNYHSPNDAEIKLIYDKMKKRREGDFLNCSACGYGSCSGMAEAIFNGLNRPENCHQYLSIELEVRNRLLHETFGRYLSDDIVNSLLESPSAITLGGKEHNVTIMMTDLRGFTNISENLSGSKVVTMLNHYLAMMIEHIQKYRGTVIEFLGDGLLCLFGAPVETQNHADEAVACAIEMQNRMKAVNAWNKENGFPILNMGIGINTGECIVGNIGSEKTMKFSVIGQNVNVCARIESYTTGGQIYISENTQKSAKSELRIENRESVHPKGLASPISIFLVEGIGAPYNLEKTVARTYLRNLKKPLNMLCFPVKGKHLDVKAQKCVILSISETEAVIICRNIDVLENIRLCIDETESDEVFAKVTKKIKDYCYLITFTFNSEFLFEKLKICFPS
jgi:class 3 adenylate cyclase/ferredoxin